MPRWLNRYAVLHAALFVFDASAAFVCLRAAAVLPLAAWSGQWWLLVVLGAANGVFAVLQLWVWCSRIREGAE